MGRRWRGRWRRTSCGSEPLIPAVPRRHRFPGRKRIDDRKVVAEILFVLRTGIPWEYLPQGMGRDLGDLARTLERTRRTKKSPRAGTFLAGATGLEPATSGVTGRERPASIPHHVTR